MTKEEMWKLFQLYHKVIVSAMNVHNDNGSGEMTHYNHFFAAEEAFMRGLKSLVKDDVPLTAPSQIQSDLNPKKI